jgi:hypothetical protein
MTVTKWIAATALALGLSAGAFAENQHWGKDRHDNAPVYSQRYSNDRDYAWSNSYHGWDRERNGGDRDMRNRDHNDRDRDHGRRDADDRVRGD